MTIGEGNFITIKGPLGKMERKMHRDMVITREDDKIVVKGPLTTSSTNPFTG